jgi:hypothetical protein
MAEVPDGTTGWEPFLFYCRRRAERIVPVTAREQEAERLTFEEVLRRKLELSWRDVDGREYVGLPLGFSGWSAYYDSFADAIRESRFGGRALYEPRVRERQRKLDKPTNESVAPIVTSAEFVKLDEPDDRDEPVKPDEPTDQWPWRKDPALRADDGTEPRQIQLECEQKLTPLIRHDSDAKIRKALEKVGVSASDSSIRRAFGRK